MNRQPRNEEARKNAFAACGIACERDEHKTREERERERASQRSTVRADMGERGCARVSVRARATG